MNFDLRIPIGLMFTTLGAVLVVFGMVSNPEIYQRSLGINVNFWWGCVMLLFGVSMLLMAWRGKGQR
jgi:protein-S-isoprenylcysteine O-methyltransferase Ste14